jgi:hypothetical protein
MLIDECVRGGGQFHQTDQGESDVLDAVQVPVRHLVWLVFGRTAELKPCRN